MRVVEDFSLFQDDYPNSPNLHEIITIGSLQDFAVERYRIRLSDS
ncbi:unnamed protein product [Onchocerca flexuosa]|uniref:AraC family transcriptional regulator n=1 Tax=Onchocerca flexuosa TaxID=387005 RepID=A0A183HXW8_9BILA|nr:unnamed protein product [Onchocerca flexuosa]